METHYKAEHVHLPILECFILDDEEIDNVICVKYKCHNFSLWKKYLDMALGGEGISFWCQILK